MNHAQLIQMLAIYGLLAAGFAASLGLFLSVKREIHTQAVKNRKQIEALARVTEHDQGPPPEPIYIPIVPRSAMNINRRVQAMRMYRHNEDLARIATVLGVPRREVELLIRVHQTKPQI